VTRAHRPAQMVGTPAADADLLRQTLRATGISAVALARVLDVDPRTVRRWKQGVPMSGPARTLCAMLVECPDLLARLDPDLVPPPRDDHQ